MKPPKSKLAESGVNQSATAAGATGQTDAGARRYQPQRRRRSIKLDRVKPSDFTQFENRFFCDDCCHFSPSTSVCTMGYVPQHTRDLQIPIYERTGMMAFCRFLEID